MKKKYETPVVEKVEFDYEENVVASNTQTNKKEKYCYACWTQYSPCTCKD